MSFRPAWLHRLHSEPVSLKQKREQEQQPNCAGLECRSVVKHGPGIARMRAGGWGWGAGHEKNAIFPPEEHPVSEPADRECFKMTI